ncbi:MAG: hypothetical protein ACTSPY_16935 [Candidatus Helarchaeota archaeon]
MTPIIMEIGRYSTKIGYAGESFPRINIPSLLGYFNTDLDEQVQNYLIQTFGISELPEIFCGDSAVYYSKLLKKIPLIYEDDFYDLELLDYFLEYIIYSYDFNLNNQDFILIQPFNSQIIQSIAELLFAKYNCKSIIPIIQPFADLVASGVENGSALIVDIGHYNCNFTPIFRGNIVSEGLLRSWLGGDTITSLLEKEIIPLIENTQSWNIIDPYYLANDIKESIGFVSLSPKRDFRYAMDGKLTKIIPLFQGEFFELHIPLFNCSEVLFNPGLFEINEYSLKDLIAKSVLNCTNTLRREISNNIIITGGGSALDGLRERLIREMVGEFGDLEFNIISFQEINDPRYSAWIGASKIFASNQDLTPITITIDKYTKSGGTISIDQDYYSNMTEIALSSLKAELPPMDPIHIALPLKYVYDILFNIISHYRKISIQKISDMIHVPELKVIKMIYTLIARNLIYGEIDQQSFEFNNLSFGKEQVLQQKQPTSAPTHTPTSTPTSASSFSSTSYQSTPSPTHTTSTISNGLKQKVLNAQNDSSKIEIDDSIPTFMKIDAAKKDEWEKLDSPVITEDKLKKLRKPKPYSTTYQISTDDSTNIKTSRKRKMPVLQETEFTFQKIDQQLQDEWERDDSPILTPEKERKFKLQKIQRIQNIKIPKIEDSNLQSTQRRVNQIPEELLQGPSFLYHDKSLNEKLDETPQDKKSNNAQSYFDLLESRTKPKEIKKLDPNLLTSADLLASDDSLKHTNSKTTLLQPTTDDTSNRPQPKNDLLLPPSKTPKYTSKPRNAKLLVPEVPTFKLLDESRPEPTPKKDKIELDGLLTSLKQPSQPKKTPHVSNIPTFLKLDNLSDEQLQKIKEIEEEEKKKREKEPKLL